MDTKANLANRKKINELAIQHNKLTTLVACLLNEISSLKKEIQGNKGDSAPSNRGSSTQSSNNTNKFPNFNDLRAEDILKQLSINNSDN
jgi:outer membrane murein-binding lipoprotein Lpp